MQFVRDLARMHATLVNSGAIEPELRHFAMKAGLLVAGLDVEEIAYRGNAAPSVGALVDIGATELEFEQFATEAGFPADGLDASSSHTAARPPPPSARWSTGGGARSFCRRFLIVPRNCVVVTSSSLSTMRAGVHPSFEEPQIKVSSRP